MHRLPRYKLCFVCGRENLAGLDIQFYRDGPRVFCDWVPAEKHLGFRDRVHGGVVASILDEAMGWAPAAGYGRLCYSIEITIKYRRPVPEGETYRVEAEAIELKPRAATARGRILDASGVVCAESSGVFFPLKQERMAEIFPHLYIEGEDREVTAADL